MSRLWRRRLFRWTNND